MAENSTASESAPRHGEAGKGAGPISMTQGQGPKSVPDPNVTNGANKPKTLPDPEGKYPSPEDQVTMPNAGVGLGKQVADLAKAVEQLTKFVVAQNTPPEPQLTKEEEELVKVLEDYFADLEKRLESKMEERLVKHEESMKKMALTPVATTPAAPVPATERTAALDAGMKKVEETATGNGQKFKSFDEIAKEVTNGGRVTGRF